MSECSAVLHWLPVGAGSRVSPHTSRLWELCSAAIEHRRPQPLFHCALEIFVGGDRTLIEMAPAWGVPAAERGVVASGPVGLRLLGRSRFFRYEVRCWPEGILPDRQWAVGRPLTLPLSREQAEGILRATTETPALLWGRRVPGARDMWNSNSLIAWLLCGAGIDAADIHPPAGGRAPGWAAGLAVARAPSPA